MRRPSGEKGAADRRSSMPPPSTEGQLRPSKAAAAAMHAAPARSASSSCLGKRKSAPAAAFGTTREKTPASEEDGGCDELQQLRRNVLEIMELHESKKRKLVSKLQAEAITAIRAEVKRCIDDVGQDARLASDDELSAEFQRLRDLYERQMEADSARKAAREAASTSTFSVMSALQQKHAAAQEKATSADRGAANAISKAKRARDAGFEELASKANKRNKTLGTTLESMLKLFG